VLRIFGPKREEVTVGWRKLYDEEFEREKFIQIFWYKIMEERDQLENMGIDGRIILRRIDKRRWEYLDWIHLGC
jgi:hypothetical protein